MAGNGPLFFSYHGRKRARLLLIMHGVLLFFLFYMAWVVFLSFLFNMAGIVVLSFLLVVAVFFSPNQKAYLSFLTLLL
jgi:hypothetical protein